FAGSSCVSVCHVGGTLLVPRESELEGRVDKCVEYGDGGASRQSKNVLDALLLNYINYDFRAGFEISTHIASKCILNYSNRSSVLQELSQECIQVAKLSSRPLKNTRKKYRKTQNAVDMSVSVVNCGNWSRNYRIMT